MVRDAASLLAEVKLDSVLLFTTSERPDSHFTYFTGLRKVTGCLAVGRQKKILFVSPLEYGVARSYSTVRNIRVMGKDFYKKLRTFSGRRVGVNYEHLSVNRLKKIRQVLKIQTKDVSRQLGAMRMVKEKDELARIAEACRLTDKILQKVCRDARSMRTELEMKLLIETLMRERGVEPSFDVIVASGKNGATPHHLSGHSRLRGMTVVDMGVRLKGYCSDITRTICFGTPTRQELEGYRLVKQVQESCVSMVREGEDFSVINQYAQKRMGKALLHSIGHGLGIDVHELPFATTERGKTVLKEGMVVTIEPGVYYPGKFGIRIEDDVAVEKSGCEILTKTGKELLII